MISLIETFFVILLIIVFHMLIFILYPDTGKYGEYFFYGLISFWIFLYIYIITTRTIKFFLSNFFLRIVFFILMTITSLTIIPQDDKTIILKKILTGKLPDQQQIERGKIKYFNHIIKKTLNPILDEIYDGLEMLIDKIKKLGGII